jgi:RNA polymerase sigma-70 factor (sigma-E family)
MEELTSGGSHPPAVLSTALAPEMLPALATVVRPSFEEFVLARTDRLLRTAYLLTGDRALAEDLLQTALAKVWTAWRRIEDPDAYIRKIMVNTYATWWRRRWNGERPTESLPEVITGSEIDAHAERRDLWSALGRLPRRQQAAVVLRYYEGLTEAETAAVLGCSVGTVKSQTSRALAKLRIDPALAAADDAPQGESR